MKKGNITVALFGCALLSTSYVATTVTSMAYNKPGIQRTIASEKPTGEEVGFEATGAKETEVVARDIHLPISVADTSDTGKPKVEAKVEPKVDSGDADVQVSVEEQVNTEGKLQAQGNVEEPVGKVEVSVDIPVEHAMNTEGKLAAMGNIPEEHKVKPEPKKAEVKPEIEREREVSDIIGDFLGDNFAGKFFKGDYQWQQDRREKLATEALREFVYRSDDMKDLNISTREDVVKGLKELISALNENESDINKSLVSLGEKAEELKKLKRELEKEKETNAEAIKEKEVQIAELEQAVKDLETLIGSKSELQERMLALQGENRELKQKLADETAAKECYADKVSKLEDEVKEKTKDYDKLLARVEKLEEGKEEYEKEKKKKKKKDEDGEEDASRDDAYANHIMGLIGPLLGMQQQLAFQNQLNQLAQTDNSSVVASLMGGESIHSNMLMRNMLMMRSLERLGDDPYKINSFYSDQNNWYKKDLLHINPIEGFHTQFLKNNPMVYTPENALQLNQLSLHGAYNWSPLGTTPSVTGVTPPLASTASDAGVSTVTIF